jgi:putative phosphoesterase
MPKNFTTVALLADSHGHLDPRVRDIALGASIVVHAGDIGGGAILETLGAAGGRVVAVAGNNDTPRHWPADERDTLDALPECARLELPGGLLVVEHGHRFAAKNRHARLRRAWPEAAAIVCGHSHRRVLDCTRTPWILNPGACGRSRAYGGPGCLLLQAAAGEWRVDEVRFAPLPRGRRCR